MTENTLYSWQMPITINLFSLIILFVFLFDHKQKGHGTRAQNYIIFHHMIVTNILLLVTDGICWLVIGQPGWRTVHIITNTLFYALETFPSFFFVCLIDIVLQIPRAKRKKLALWYMIPVVIHTAMAALTPFTGWFFVIDEANQYTRGSLFAVSYGLSYVLMFVGFFKVMQRFLRARKEDKEIAKNMMQFSWVLKFSIIPLLGGVIQIFFTSMTYVWNVTVIALLILYINNQNSEIVTDTLSGLYNRRQAFAYFDRILHERNNETIAVVVLDINNFKTINDKFGHMMGDEAIVAVARSLEHEFHHDDVVCRFGGDEFVVITKHGETSIIEKAITAINQSLGHQFNKKLNPYNLSLSVGYAVVQNNRQTLDQLFSKADAMMFEQKATLMRRAGDRRK